MTSCSPGTIRFYEKKGIFSPSDRTPRNYRLYNETDLARLRFILHCRQRGIKIRDIAMLLKFRSDLGGDCHWAHEVVEKRLAQVENEIGVLSQLRDELKELINARHGEKDDICPIIRYFENSAS